MRAKDAATSPVVTVLPEASLAEVARVMLGKGIGSVLVVDRGGCLVGIVTKSDVLKERGVPLSAFRAPMLLGRFLGSDGLDAVGLLLIQVGGNHLLSVLVLLGMAGTVLTRA